MSALAKAQSRGNAIWQEARARNDFSAFAPALAELIALRRQQASQLAAAEPVARSPWEILAQPFEPDISKARLEELFAPLKAELPALLEQVASSHGSGHHGGGRPARRPSRKASAPSCSPAGATTRAAASAPARPIPSPAPWDPTISASPPGW